MTPSLIARTFGLIAFCGLGSIAGITTCAATPMLTQDQAAARVLANGFRLVAKAEPAPRQSASWDVWASKDGIAYRVTIDANTGDLIKAAPAVEDD